MQIPLEAFERCSAKVSARRPRLFKSCFGVEVPYGISFQPQSSQNLASETQSCKSSVRSVSVCHLYTYGIVSEGVFAASLQKFCRKFAEICTKKKKNVSLRQERVRKFCGKLQKCRGNVQIFFCNDPFPSDPISELLSLEVGRELS